MLIKWDNVGVSLYWRLRRENLLTKNVLDEFYSVCVSVRPYTHTHTHTHTHTQIYKEKKTWKLAMDKTELRMEWMQGFKQLKFHCI
jgi:hypothetical protein